MSRLLLFTVRHMRACRSFKRASAAPKRGWRRARRAARAAPPMPLASFPREGTAVTGLETPKSRQAGAQRLKVVLTGRGAVHSGASRLARKFSDEWPRNGQSVGERYNRVCVHLPGLRRHQRGRRLVLPLHPGLAEGVEVGTHQGALGEASPPDLGLLSYIPDAILPTPTATTLARRPCSKSVSRPPRPGRREWLASDTPRYLTGTFKS